jgi:sugar O-acyltransferase (sialic acid O-acetyltransferase NeuD family)
MAQINALDNLYFFDNVSDNVPATLLNRFRILRSLPEAREVFDKLGDRSFALGLGNPVFRYSLFVEFQRIGGELTSVISPGTDIGKFEVDIAPGCCILPGVVITSHVVLGKGCLLNPNVTVSHDSVLGNFVEASPGVRITGNCQVGDFCFIGSNAVILPKVKLGRNVIVGAGAVVTRDVPDNSMVVGVPAVIKKKLAPLGFEEK